MIDFLLDVTFESANEPLSEEISARLFLTSSTGSRIREAEGTTTLTAFFENAEERDAGAEALSDLEGAVLRPHEAERLDWLDLYQQSLEPIFIGERFVVAPDPSLIPADTSRLSLVIPQEQGFGTGSHETTALCIELLSALPIDGQRGLDVGTGSGILALAMHRLGAEKVIAFDNDPDAYAAMRDNRNRNDVAESALPLFIGGVQALRGGSFDVITMNILPEVIVMLLDDVVARLSPDGALLLSGILLVRRDEVVDACGSRGLALVREKVKGEWWAGVFEFRPRSKKGDTRMQNAEVRVEN